MLQIKSGLAGAESAYMAQSVPIWRSLPTWRRVCLHGAEYAYMAQSMPTWRRVCLHGAGYAYMAQGMLSRRERYPICWRQFLITGRSQLSGRKQPVADILGGGRVKRGGGA